MPATTQRDLQRPLLDAVRESQAAVIDVVRAWTDITERLTRDLRLPVARVDLAEAVDRVFDLAEQTLAAQRQLALTVAGAATRQAETAVDSVAATVDSAVEDAAATVEAVEDTVRERPPQQDRRPDGRTYEERTLEELRERAAELEIEGRSTMTKDELIAALRSQRRSRSASRGQSR